MFEVLLSLSLLPDIDPADQVLPDIKPLYPGCSDGRIRELEQKDRESTRECSKKALERLKELGLVQKIPN